MVYRGLESILFGIRCLWNLNTYYITMISYFHLNNYNRDYSHFILITGRSNLKHIFFHYFSFFHSCLNCIHFSCNRSVCGVSHIHGIYFLTGWIFDSCTLNFSLQLIVTSWNFFNLNSFDFDLFLHWKLILNFRAILFLLNSFFISILSNWLSSSSSWGWSPSGGHCWAWISWVICRVARTKHFLLIFLIFLNFLTFV